MASTLLISLYILQILFYIVFCQEPSELSREEISAIFGDLPINSQSREDYQVVLLPSLHQTEAVITDDEPTNYGFNAFGRSFNLRLRRNTELIAPNLKVFAKYRDFQVPVPGPIPSCHFLNEPDHASIAALSMCQPDSVHGFILTGNETLEVRPLPARLNRFATEALLAEGDIEAGGQPHIVRRSIIESNPIIKQAAPFIVNPLAQAEFQTIEEIFNRESTDSSSSEDAGPNFREKRAATPITVEVAMFADEATCRIFGPYLGHDDAQLRDMLLAYLNGVQALYHHPSAGTKIDLALVRLELLKSQPSDLPSYGGERGQLLDSFCAYQAKHNPKDDKNPDHWDMGLYISALDFFAIENGRKSGVTMGLATVGGVCHDNYACVIAELGTINAFGKPYPSAGFNSVFILAHEIGHNLGMHHDSSQNSCPKDGYVMSPSRGTSGETIWSHCSAEVLAKLSGWAKCLQDVPKKQTAERDHGRFLEQPGQFWGAKRQCEVLLRDRDAAPNHSPSSLREICQNLKCRTPNRSGFYFAGPALEGTTCGSGKMCYGGECIMQKKKKPIKVVKGGWSEWKTDSCKSGCIQKSRGSQSRRRTCDNPKPINTEEGCSGISLDFLLCKDDKICKKSKRKSSADYASEKCKEYSKLLPELDPKGSGLQAPHEPGRLWMACAVFCRRKDTGSFYTPRVELNDLGADPYFPDGTWCHQDGNKQYYCLHHHCLPEDFKLSGKSGMGNLGDGLYGGEDIPVPQNAPPRHIPLGGDLLRYLSLDQSGKPLLTTLPPGSTKPPADEEWADEDYRELPAAEIQKLF